MNTAKTYLAREDLKFAAKNSGSDIPGEKVDKQD